MGKICSKCGADKDLEEFRKTKYIKSGRRPDCNVCRSKQQQRRYRNKLGRISCIYASQRRRSKLMGFPMPSYTIEEFKEWLLGQDKYHVLFDGWIQSGYKKGASPSCDRKDDYKPYTLDNLRLSTWDENKKRGSCDRRNGINNKVSNKVAGVHKGTGERVEYYSARSAARDLNITAGGIIRCCSGKQKSAAGYYWKYIE